MASMKTIVASALILVMMILNRPVEGRKCYMCVGIWGYKIMGDSDCMYPYWYDMKTYECPGGEQYCYVKYSYKSLSSDKAAAVDRGCSAIQVSHSCSKGDDHFETCYTTCNSDGCNGASKPAGVLAIILPLVVTGLVQVIRG
ncbi:U-scoloptoxin(05)-Sm1a-like [Branchiostoma floridae]|uniref:U-scoloptoxin(05)-Sm1a-like n=1 Tax=Branchiostoma floridae TaxID=7739 RepID=C3Z5U1_BRAFL|nr:U-scoloptoxin(05)-Sm1a-like [Branchiostoma floridae]|eukprot:XP_002596192.1 hypothetical protein BRAFLDRAFT_118017 [Branchiostoma floridae]